MKDANGWSDSQREDVDAVSNAEVVLYPHIPMQSSFLPEGTRVKVKHQPEHGTQVVTGVKVLYNPITLHCGKVVCGYVMVGDLGGYHLDNLEVL